MQRLTQENKHLPVLIAILFLAVALRFYGNDKSGIWLDEEYSLLEANGLIDFHAKNQLEFTGKDISSYKTFSHVVSSCVQGDGGNGIFYLITLHYWTCLFSNSDFSIRSLSGIAGVLLVLVSYYLSLLLFRNYRVALLTAFLFAISPMFIFYSQSARAYMFGTLFSLYATYCLLIIFREKRINKTAFLYSIAVIAGLLSHYSTVYIFLTHALICVIAKLNYHKWKTLLTCAFFISSVFLLWMFNGGIEGLRIIAEKNKVYEQLSAADPENSFYLPATHETIAKGWMQNILSTSGNNLQWAGLRLREIMFWLFAPLGLITLTFLRRKNLIEKQNLLYLSALFLSSLVYATILAFRSGHIISFQIAYSIFSIPYLLFLIACPVMFLESQSKASILIISILLISQVSIMIVSDKFIYNGYAFQVKSGNMNRVAAEKLNKFFAAREFDELKNVKIVFHDKWSALLTSLYLDESCDLITRSVDVTSESRIILKSDALKKPGLIISN